MSGAVTIQYVGFEAKLLTREYTFNVRESGEDREFRLNIANDAFVSHRASYQDAPGICALKLKVELDTFSNRPPKTDYDISVAELDNYKLARLPESGRKAQQNF